MAKFTFTVLPATAKLVRSFVDAESQLSTQVDTNIPMSCGGVLCYVSIIAPQILIVMTFHFPLSWESMVESQRRGVIFPRIDCNQSYPQGPKKK